MAKPILVLALLYGQTLPGHAFPLGAAERAGYAAFLNVPDVTGKRSENGATTFNNAVYARCLMQMERDLPPYGGFERRYLQDSGTADCFTVAANPGWLDLLLLRAPPSPFDGHFRAR